VIETQDEGRIVELFRQTLMHVWRACTAGRSPRACAHRPGQRRPAGRAARCQRGPADDPPGRAAGVYLLLDFHPYLGYASHQRALRDLIQRRHSEPHVLVLIGAKVELPAELEALAVRFNPRLPDANAC
jgi:hypothetical protein